MQPEPDIVINGRGNDSSVDSVGSNQHGRQSPHGLDGDNRLGQACNPNRAEMPSTGMKKSYDPVSEGSSGRRGGGGIIQGSSRARGSSVNEESSVRRGQNNVGNVGGA